MDKRNIILYGLDIDRPMLTKIELKKREVFNVSTEELFKK